MKPSDVMVGAPLRLRRFAAWAGGAALVTVGLFGCDPDAGGPGAPPASSALSGAGLARRQLTGHVSPAMARAPRIRQLERSKRLDLVMGLALGDPDGLDRLAMEISDPKSGSFRQYLTPEEVGQRFGATETDYSQAVAWARSKGFDVKTHANRFVVQITGDAPTIENAFHVRMNVGSRPDGSEFYGPDAEPSLDLAVPVSRIGGLDNFERPIRAGTGGTGPGGCLWGKDLRNAYAPSGCSSLDGTGQQIGIFIANHGFLTTDITAYEAQTGLTGVPTVQVIGTNNTGALDVETALDIDMALTMAPKATVVAFGSDFDTAFSNMAANPSVKQISSSWTVLLDATARSLIAELAVQGQSFTQMTGDGGALPQTAGFPSYNGINDLRTQPTITTVGATNVAMKSPGVSWQSEVAWSLSTGGIENGIVNNTGVGTPIPSYQLGLATAANQASSTYRNVPDVAMEGSCVGIIYNGAVTQVGGTSVAAPLWAGFIALANQSLTASQMPSVGFANPALYSIAAAHPDAFHDITSGSNPSVLPGGNGLTYNCTTGYDLVTGLGSPQCGLINYLATPLTFTGNPAVSARGLVGATQSGIFDIFAVQSDNHLVLHRTFTKYPLSGAPQYGPWEALPGGLTAPSSPAAASWATNTIDVFVVDGSHLKHASWASPGPWSGWDDRGCCLDTAPTAASWGTNRLDVFAGSGGGLWHTWHDGSSWYGWNQIPGLTNMVGAPTAVSWGSGRIDIVARDAGNNFRWTSYNNPSGWTAWTAIGCCFDTSPSLSTWGTNRLDVFGGIGGTLWHGWYAGGPTWVNWDSHNGSMTSAPSATSWGSNRIDIMATTTGSVLEHMDWNNQWDPWTLVLSPKYGSP